MQSFSTRIRIALLLMTFTTGAVASVGCGSAPDDGESSGEYSEDAPDMPENLTNRAPSGGLKKGDRGDEVYDLYRYLKTYGYFPNPALEVYPGWRPVIDSDPADPRVFDDDIEEALSMFQRAHGLPDDRTLNDETLELMAKPRCGFPDYYDGSEQHAKGDDETSEFVLVGSRWPSTSVSYSFTNYTPDLAPAVARGAVLGGLGRWSKVSLLNFTEAQAADIQIGWHSGDHGDGYPFDGAGSVLAHAFFPTGGDAHFDEAETWTTGGGGIDLESVAVHEFGHSLGLSHSADSNAVMYAFYSGVKRDLTADDILGMQALYGTTAKAFQSYSNPGSYIRHQNALGYIAPIASQQERVDSQFRLVPGLANAQCVSFRSINQPNRYFRQVSSRLELHDYSIDSQYKNDATFCIRPGKADPTLVSFESYNTPGSFIRQSSSELWVQSGVDDVFKADSTFRIVNIGGGLDYSASNTSSATTNTVNHAFKLGGGQTVTLGTCGVVGSSGTGDTYLRLFNPAATNVASNDDSCGLLSKLSYTAPANGGGMFEIRAGCYSSASCSGTVVYSLSTAGSFAYNASNTNSATVNTVDRAVTLSAGQTLILGTCGVSGASATGDTLLRLLGPNAVEVTANDDNCGALSSYLTYTVPEGQGGTYTIRAGCFAGNTCSGNVAYTF